MRAAPAGRLTAGWTRPPWTRGSITEADHVICAECQSRGTKRGSSWEVAVANHYLLIRWAEHRRHLFIDGASWPAALASSRTCKIKTHKFTWADWSINLHFPGTPSFSQATFGQPHLDMSLQTSLAKGSGLRHGMAKTSLLVSLFFYGASGAKAPWNQGMVNASSYWQQAPSIKQENGEELIIWRHHM